ncbi:uncharacterized protein LOC134285477 [Aedes albopictus]|uniref:Endonuclease n=1 Tax=Aedes albopictus TaxID=7160 RepID=A0ABM1XRL4_AEDAL
MSNPIAPSNNSNPATPDNKDESNGCVCCDRPETVDDCVQCDQCNGWWHMRCAEVTTSVADRSWTCSHCLPLSVTSRTTTSSIRAARLALKKKLLEEQQAMEQRHLAEKYKLLEEELNEMDETGSNRSRISKRTSLENVEQWQRKCAKYAEAVHRPQPTDQLAKVASALQLPPNEPEGDSECTAAGPAVDPNTHETEPNKPTAEGLASAEMVQRGGPSETVTGGRHEVTFHKPTLNSTVKSSSFPASGRVKGDPQRSTGAIPRTAQKHQEVVNATGNVDPQVPPVAPQGKPLLNPSIPQNSENSLQQMMKQFGSLAPYATVSLNRTSESNILPKSGTSVGFQPPANPIITPGLVPHAAELPNVGPSPPANSIPYSGLVPPLAGLPNVGQVPQVNPVQYAGQVPPLVGLPNVGYLPQAYPVQCAGQVPPPSGLPTVDQFTPSPSQLAARQVMSRELPTFSGDPADWPIFISSFTNSSLACGYNSAENLARLQRCLKGPAYESVRSRLLLPESVPQVIDTLRLLYGRPELLISAQLQKVRSVPAPKAEKLETIIDFGIAVRSLCDHLEAAGQQEHLSNPTLLMELVEKLPAHTKLQWADYMQHHPVVNLKVFGDFMLRVVTAVSRVTMYVGGDSGNQQKTKQKGTVNAHISETGPESELVREKERVCVCCKKPGHRIADCSTFKSYTVDNRWKFAQNNGLCRSCLNTHGRRICRNAMQCGIDGCEYRHHTLLHSNRSSATERPTQGMSTVQNHTHRQYKQVLLFRIIPVVVSGPRGTVETFAFLDDGSDLSLIERSLVEQLGIDGWTKPLCLKWTGNVTRVESESKQVRISIQGVSSQKQHSLNDIRTVKELTLPEQSLNYDELCQRYRYLQGLPIVSYEKAVPRLLIGVNNANLTVPLQVREGRQSEPIAVKTRLGWCIFGGSPKDSTHFKTHSLNLHACECENVQELHNTVKDYFTVEDAGVKPTAALESEEDKRARIIMERTTLRVGKQFKTGLLWKYDNIEFPDSYTMAIKRLECLERKMIQDPELAVNLKKQIAEYQTKGYAYRATEKELTEADPKKVWYLPLGVVTNPRKPGKVRLIWDAAAKVDGISLNTMLLKGPDQLTSLPAVLSRFRQYKVGVSADIKEMFHQLLICEEDRHSQRFLFRSDPLDQVEIYVMNVATFGSTCSPASAQYVKNRNAEEFINNYPRAVEGILKNHYVDDYLDSFENEEEAERVAQEIRLIHQEGGFQLRNWLSNSVEVLRGLNEENPEESKSLCLPATEYGDRVLGMLWQTAEDNLCFSIKMKEEIQKVIDSRERPTKRQVLKCLMGIFDPLGLLAVYLVHGKILLQDVWRTGLQWDERLPEEIFDRWIRWTDLFCKIEDLRIPRCYFKNATVQTYEQLQLHVFVDASEAAFSAVAYFRVMNTNGEAECSIVAAKTKVAPLKPLSIPRLELQAAVLGSRLMAFVQEIHSVEVKKRFLWSDSATVLAWLRADHRRYKQYVACRIGELLSTTDVAEWQWIPSKLNPADAATKWGTKPLPGATDEWFTGPEFLRFPEENWPRQVKLSVQPEEELRPCFFVKESTIPEVIVDFSRFSKWRKLLGAVAYLHRFIENCRRRLRGEQLELLYLSQEDLKRAKNTIVRLVQWQEFPDEMVLLSKGQGELPKTSSLFQLTPTIDECGVLRIDGRIGAATYTPFDTRFPVILSKKHPVTKLIVEDFHRTFLHGNSETVVNEIRQYYHVSRLRTVVKQVAATCQWCKVKKATPKVPRMAPLPVARLSSFTRPFTHIGIDFFGPLLVKVGRSTPKRWICLFTCLTTRAVHVEVAHSLSTNSCVQCVRRFIGRRGAPAEIYTDNGTNFQGAERLLQEQLRGIHGELAATFTNTNTKWIFIPPAAPHMGGAWERMVRSVKSAMEAAYNNDRKLDDEGLETLVIEAESIVNSRPLTYLPLEAAETEALTPNHFLLGSSTGVRQPAVPFSDPTTALKNTWTQIQHQLDVFWKRWIREYLPMLTKRMKWFGEVAPIAVGDLVLIVDDARRNGWTRGRVQDVVKAEDGRIRQAVIQTARGIVRRPVSKLAVLEVELDGKTGTGGQCYGGEDVTASTSPRCDRNRTRAKHAETSTVRESQQTEHQSVL